MSIDDKNESACQRIPHRTLHFECCAGISGDMTLGALVDLGVDKEALIRELSKLPVDGWKLEFHHDSRGGICGIHPVVVMADGSTDHLAEEHDEHHHGQEPEGHHHEHHHHGQEPDGHHHGQEHHEHHYHEHHHEGHHHEQEHDGHHHGQEHDGHHHEHHHGQKPDEHHHGQNHHHEGYHHEHRRWKDIRKMINGAELSGGAKDYALKIFSVLAEAEAEVHGTAVDEVAFHEVGAVDSIIDIVGTAICLDMLAPDKITSGVIELGGGTVRCAHGILPVPAPAVLKLCHGIPCISGGFDKEMTTPTGAAILRACVDEFVTAATSAFVPIKEGIGIGTRRMDKPNFLRVSLRETGTGAPDGNGEENCEGNGSSSGGLWLEEKLFSLECTIDDMTGEDFGFLQERLFHAGALDVAFIPCTMKKNRPGIIVQVLCKRENLDAARLTLFTKSTTIGFRETAVKRLSLRREEAVIETADGAMRVKKVYLGEEFLRQKIEYDDRIKHERDNA